MSERHEGLGVEGVEPSEEAVLETAEALVRMIEDGQAKGMRPEEIPGQLYDKGYLGRMPHYVEVLAAMTEAGAEYVMWGHVQTGEDLLQKYVREKRMQEVRRQTEAQRRRADLYDRERTRQRDFEERGLSAEESDRFSKYLTSARLGRGGKFLTLPAVPDEWFPRPLMDQEEQERRDQEREKRRQRLRDIRSLEDLRAYEQEFVSEASSP